MADIAGVGTFGFQPVRSNPDVFRTQNEDPAARDQDVSLRARATEDAELARGVEPPGFSPAEEGGETGAGTAQPQPAAEDRVTLSNQAQELSGLDQQGLGEPPTLIDQIDQAGAAQQVPSQVAGVDANTNQQVSEESTSAVLNGNQDGRQTEQNRTLGQLVDQFA